MRLLVCYSPTGFCGAWVPSNRVGRRLIGWGGLCTGPQHSLQDVMERERRILELTDINIYLLSVAMGSVSKVVDLLSDS